LKEKHFLWRKSVLKIWQKSSYRKKDKKVSQWPLHILEQPFERKMNYFQDKTERMNKLYDSKVEEEFVKKWNPVWKKFIKNSWMARLSFFVIWEKKNVVGLKIESMLFLWLKFKLKINTFLWNYFFIYLGFQSTFSFLVYLG
jgi:hypothetical protein